MSSVPWLTVAGAIPLAGALVIAAIPSLPANGVDADREARNLLSSGSRSASRSSPWPGSSPMAVQFKPNGPNFQFNQTVSVDPAVRGPLRGRGGRDRAGPDRHVGRLMPVVILASWHDRPRAGRAQREDVLRADAGPGDDDDRRLRGHRRLPVLRLLRSHADPDVLHDRELRHRQTAVRGGQVPALQPGSAACSCWSPSSRCTSTRPGAGSPATSGTFLFSQLEHLTLSPDAQKWMFLGFFVAFAIKAPLLPFHTWLPDAAASAQPGGGGAAGRRAGQGRHVRHDPVLPGAVPVRVAATSPRWSSCWR